MFGGNNKQSTFRLAEWAYQIVDFCRFSHRVVEISMSLLDRFANSYQDVLRDRNLYQLASMTALYTSIKTHEPEAIAPALMASLSQGLFQPKQIEDMEVFMLMTLKWKVHPPTATDFLQSFFLLRATMLTALISFS